ncbi:MAG TPA: hypothetical protein DCL38_01425 [Lachnospiraceae bacterium]|nr:hypothetical protein [Lachnospiraceae bacterium]
MDIPIGNRGIRAAINAGDLDILFIGSSTFRCNIDMPTMDEAYDGRVYDISYGGNQLVAASIQYDEIKSRSANKYDLIVFELNPMMLTEKVALSDSRVIWDLSWDGKKKLWEKLSSSGNTDSSVLYEYFVTSGMDDLFTYPVTEPFYSTRYYKGAKTDETPSPGPEVLENAEFDISGETLVPAQEEAVIELLEKCRRDGQAFIFLECPHYYRLQEDPTYQKYLDYYLDLLDRNNAACILAGDVSFDDHEAAYFEDMNHMSAEGRRLYTKKLIKLLKGPEAP